MIRRLPFAIMLAALLSACVPEFANPLLGGNSADPGIMGNWVGKAAGDTDAMPLAITPDGEGVKVVLSNEKGDKTLPDAMTFKGTTAQLGGVHYINLRPVGPDVPKGTGRLIFRYEAMADGTIQVWGLDDTAIAAAIDDGKLNGSVTGSGSDTSPHITATSGELAAFFATPAGQAAFSSGTGDVLVLTRTKP